MNRDSSDDEEDVFSCGRCKENFSNMESFMEHKKSQSCRKTKQRPLENQQQRHSLLPEIPIGSSEQTVQDSAEETMRGSTASTTSPENSLNQGLVPSDPEYNPQASFPRLQDVLTVLQGGQLMGQLDVSSELSELGESRMLIQVLERILGPLSRNALSATTGIVYSPSVGCDSTENSSNEKTVSSDSSNIPNTLRESEDVTYQTEVTSPTEDISLKDTDTSQVRQKSTLEENASGSVSQELGSEGQQTLKPAGQQLTKSKQRKRITDQQALSPQSAPSPESLETGVVSIKAVMCKFCSETTSNSDGLFSHYMEVHKMRSGAALEFLQQSTCRSKRGRPPKGLAISKKRKPILCPHCSVSFNSKSLCAAHIRKHHRDTAVPPVSKTTDLPSSRRRKCARCSFQTFTAKDLTAHIHSCHSNKGDIVGKLLLLTTEEKNNSTKITQSEGKPKTQRRQKRPRNATEDVIREQDDDGFNGGSGDSEEEMMEEGDQDEIGDGQEMNSASGKAQVKCPECNKKMYQRGLKRHQVRCINKNRFICPLCQHKSRESYDHTVHVDNHRIWVKAQASWADQSTGSRPEGAVTSTEGMSSSVNINTMMADVDKVDYTSTVDLQALALITQIQGETSLLEQNQQLLTSSDSGVMEQDTQKSEICDVSLLSKGTGAKNGEAHTEQEPRFVDGGDKKLNPRDLKCKTCYTWFSRTSLPKHMLQVHNMVKRFQCRETACRLIFAKLEDFKAHIVSHPAANTFRCGCRGCVKRRLITPETMDNLRKEKMRDYYKHMSYKCSKCWVKFPSQGSLDRHMKQESHIHPCEVCGKIQVSKRQLRMHMVTHQAERAYLCEVCGQNFKTKRDLNKHTFSHNNIRPYQCPNCDKRFSFRNKMNRHIVTVHSGKKPFNCDWSGCEKAFSRKDKLAEHIKTHQVSYPFKCQHCNKGFYRKDNLKDHEIVHTGDFPFRCADCNRGFMRPKILEKHHLTEHPPPAVTTQITLQASVTQDVQADSPGQSISYVLCEPYVYANIDQLTSFQDSVQETDVQLMPSQRATIEAIQNAAAAVIGNGQAQFQIDGTDPFPVITLGT